MQRRRFLALGATAALVLAGCGRWLDPDGGSEAGDAPAGGDRDADDGSAGRDRDAAERSRSEDGTAEDTAGEDATTGQDEAGEDGAAGETDEQLPSASDVDPALRDAEPTEWGERVTGVGTTLANSTAIALTFDACGGSAGSGYDAALIEHLREFEVPATLFVNARWIDANPGPFAELAADPLFQIENHGTVHRPLSVTGQSAYGITGTASVDEVIEEVLGCQRRLTDLTGVAPRFFRSGTAYYDDVATQVVQQLGLQVAGYSVLGDAGATFSAAQVQAQVEAASGGDIVLLHMNHPSSGTAAGVAAALPTLLRDGRTFTTLGDHRLA